MNLSAVYVTRDDQAENVAAEIIMSMLIDAGKRLLIDAGKWVWRDNQAEANGR